MAIPPGNQAPSTKRRPIDPITYHAKLWVDSNFGELSAAVYSVGMAQAKREGRIGFLAKLANSEARKALVLQITGTAVALFERRKRMSSPTDVDRAKLLAKASEVLRLRMGTMALIAATLAAKLGLSFESEYETIPASPAFDAPGGALSQALGELDGEHELIPKRLKDWWSNRDAKAAPPPSSSKRRRTIGLPFRNQGGKAPPCEPNLDASWVMANLDPLRTAAIRYYQQYLKNAHTRYGGPGSSNVPGMIAGLAKSDALASAIHEVAASQSIYRDRVTANMSALRPALQQNVTFPERGSEQETGWETALKRSQRQSEAISPAHAHEARNRIRAAVAPAFAAALDKAIDATLLTQFAASRPGGVDAAKLRAAFIDAAVRRFAGEFVKLVGGQPPASAEDIALGAIIAVVIAETSARFTIVPPTAVAPMAVLVHRALRPQLPALARLAAVIAATTTAATPARPGVSKQPAREMAW